MSRRLRHYIARFTLATMLATFVSPMLGWAMVATHDELAHTAAVLTGEGSNHDHGLPADHDHADPHSFIGHLFSHMPFHVASGIELLPVEGVVTLTPLRAERIVSGSTSPPFRPPLPISLAN